MISRTMLRSLVALLALGASGCLTLFVLTAFEPVSIDAACGAEVNLNYAPDAADRYVTLIANNTGACPIELVSRPAGGGADKSLTSVAAERRGSVTVAAPQVQLFAKCGPLAGQRCTGEVRIVPSRKIKDGGDKTLKVLDGFVYQGDAGSCDRVGTILEHKNDSGKRQQLVVEAKNTGDCDTFIVRVGEQVAVTAGDGGTLARSNQINLGNGRSLKFEATCTGKATPQESCRGEVTIILNQMK